MERLLGRVLIVALFAMAWSAIAAGAGSEEFVGPFPSWRNVKTDYGAVGDGKADDTVAIQKALDDLHFHKDFCVLYFPAGTYRIADTVKTLRQSHQEGMGMTVVGEDPATTTLRWDGAAGGVMVKYDAWYSRISRLTLDGAGKAGVALAYGDAFSTYNETSDMVFRDVEIGMQMATATAGQAENAVLRCQFLRCATAGLRTSNFNSLDIWCWYCRFEDCGFGLLNGAGNFHAYECLFLRSKNMDIGSHNLMVFSFVNNTSLGSRCFLDWAGGHTWGSPCTIAGNRIADFSGDLAIRLGNGGPYLVMDNQIKAREGYAGKPMQLTWGDQVLVGNTYTVADPVKIAGKRLTREGDLILAERVVAPAELKIDPPSLPPAPPHRERPVFEVAKGAGSAEFQAAVDAAAKVSGQRPVVHVAMGKYRIESTVTVPAGCDVQIVGDGGAETATVIEWAGPAGQPVFLLRPPARAALRELFITAGAGVGVRVEGADQAGGQVFCDQLQINGGRGGKDGGFGVLAERMIDSDVLLRNCQGGTRLACWVKVVGDGERRGRGQTSILCGATSTGEQMYTVEKGGRLVVRSVYHEVSADTPQAVLLNDSGTLAIDATRFSYKTAADRPLFALDGFRGSFTVATGLLLPVGSQHTARLQISGDGSATEALCLGNIFWVNELGVNADKVFHNDASPAARAAMLACNMNSGTAGAAKMEGGADGFAFLDNRGQADEAFVLRMLQPLRETRVWTPSESAAALTRVEMHRLMISCGAGGVAVHLQGTAAP